MDFRISRAKTPPDAAIVLARAEELIGAPYKHLGRDRHGIDCLGLVWHSIGLTDELAFAEFDEAKALGGYYADAKWLKRDPELARACGKFLAAFLTKHLVEHKVSDAGPGDIVLMAFKLKTGEIDHAGVLGRGEIIHATRDGVIPSPLDDRLRRHVKLAFRGRLDG